MERAYAETKRWGRESLEMRASSPVADTAVDSEDHLRSRVYGLLARLLGNVPGPDTLELLSLVDGQSADGDTLGLAWRDLCAAASEATPQSLSDEFHALFVGLGRGELVPHGSWYMTGYLMERPLAALRQDLSQLGFEREDSVKEPEDHAAILCDVMAALTADDSGFDAATRADFFRRHMAPWMGRFFEDLTTAKAAGFYRSVGHFAKLFIEIEQQFYGDKPAVSALTPQAVVRTISVKGVTPKAG